MSPLLHPKNLYDWNIGWVREFFSKISDFFNNINCTPIFIITSKFKNYIVYK